MPLDRSYLDAATGGAFFSLSVADAKMLIERMVSNQGWSDDRLQPRKRGMHSIKEIDMLAAKMDLLTKRVEHYEKVSAQETLKAIVTTQKSTHQKSQLQIFFFKTPCDDE